MSEQALIDDATIVMRSRFLSGSQRISSHLSWLEAHAEDIHGEVRASVRASAERIDATLRRLTEQMGCLPETQWERFKAMLTLLRVQQDVLDSAEALMQKARANNELPKRLDPVAPASLPAASLELPSPMEAPGSRGVAALSRGPVHARYLLGMLRPTISFPVAVVAAGVVFSFVTLTGTGERQDIAAKQAKLNTGNSGSRVASLPESSETARARAGLATLPAEAPPPGRAAETLPVSPGAVGTANRPVVATIINPADEHFVPVVFTDKEKGSALRAFAELQMRYPKLLSQRRAEVQPVDLGQKGVWHRLIILPSGSRQSATDFCDQLLAVGYDRCWVKGY